ncbi:FkbM family methyltransferase [Aliiglaciecola sp. 2_MG-2023]|uniref:FkbM family methyltransferase n=1 Tax=unclassified Aliiglaciecola TaxID=2593648 RepID=UPI0026E15B95|nr:MULTISPECIES: FkbM family methyltransferase [unclassified Aliiglaciecola]MDO6709369.1 FkbM family methyltransferase [Aliiglaciecola sp. 2_MG-2023]MDO6750517.1 FkbM family methyltransferase [Aliiglaciecola sp. 1_MG-2023]
MPTEHGLISDLKFYTKKKRLKRYLKGEFRRFYRLKKQQLAFALEDYFLYKFDPFRVIAKRFEKSLPTINENYVKVGNYYLDSRILYKQSPIIYSLGVLTDISFDKAAISRFQTNVYLFDPAPIAAEYMSKQKDINLHFFPIGVWIKDSKMPFMYSKDRGRSPSMFIKHDGGIFEATCKSLKTIMSELGHNKIDILKMDIEGAALPLLEDLLEQEFSLPSQIVAEFENIRPNLEEFCDFYLRVTRLITRLNNLGYEVVNLPRDFSFYRSVELLFSKVD